MLRSRASLAAVLFAGGALALAGAACDVYDESLLGAGGGAGTTTGPGPGSGGSGGELVGCQTPAECPGVDSECGTRTCEDGVCGVEAAPAGTVATQQIPGDCARQECDGTGLVVGIIDDADAPDDGIQCTTDVCADGIPQHPFKTGGTQCSEDGGVVCNAAGACVECFAPSDCPSTICTETFTCAPASCGDGVQNGNETDLNCGGGDCPGCAIGEDCEVDGDCAGGDCGTDLTCQPTCTDTVQNQDETDVDCGGVCDPCGFGETCEIGEDCETGACGGADTCTCPPNEGAILISEVRWRGVAGANDEFVELFNPGSSSVTFSSSWTVESRSEGAASYTVRYTGEGQVIPAKGHLLLVGSAYGGSVVGDDTLASGITDEASVVVKLNGSVIDALCYSCGANNYGTHSCEGTVVTITGCANGIDRSLERKPGGAQGNCIDTDVNMDDFAELTPANPQNLASPTTG